VHFLDAATLTVDVTLDMPGSTHELALSPDGRTAAVCEFIVAYQ
jgi:hypothetical protein